METTRLTQFGTIRGSDVNIVRLMRDVMGITETGLVTDEVEVWKLNKAEDKKGNEGRWFKAKMWLPVRFYNFQYAMMKAEFDLPKAIKFVKSYLFDDDLQKSPLYLHDILAMKAGKDLSRKWPEFSYGKILNNYDNEERSTKSIREVTV